MTPLSCYSCFFQHQQNTSSLECQNCVNQGNQINKIPPNIRKMIAESMMNQAKFFLHQSIIYYESLGNHSFSSQTTNSRNGSKITQEKTRVLSINTLPRQHPVKTPSKKRKRAINHEVGNPNSNKKFNPTTHFESTPSKKIRIDLTSKILSNDNLPLLEKIEMLDRQELLSYLPNDLKFRKDKNFNLFNFLDHLIYTLLKRNIKDRNEHLNHQEIFDENKKHIINMCKYEKILLRNKVLSIKKYKRHLQIGQSIFYKVRPSFEGITNDDYDHIINSLKSEKYTNKAIQRNENIKPYIEASIAIGLGYTISETENKFITTKYSTFNNSHNDHKIFIQVLDKYMKTNQPDLYPHWHGHLLYL
jgi:hypothetical protein